MSFTDRVHSKEENDEEQTADSMFGSMDNVIKTNSMKEEKKKEPTKEEKRLALRQKLHNKINVKNYGRMTGRKKKIIRERSFDIFETTKAMMKDAGHPKIRKMNIITRAKTLKESNPQYKKLFDDYMAIFKAVCNYSMNLDMLKMMLGQTEKIRRGQMTKDEADEKMGYLLFNKYKK